MRIIDVEQGSQEWFDARAGVPTASAFDRIITMDGKPSKQRQKYMYALAGERIIGKSSDDKYSNGPMARGIEMENEARLYYILETSYSVDKVGLCLTDSDPAYGASPDGLVGKDGLLEIKCPLIYTHVGYLLKNEVPSDYYQQLQGQLLVTGRKWVDFISYYPGMKPLLIRVLPDIRFQTKLKIEIELFCSELDNLIAKLR